VTQRCLEQDLDLSAEHVHRDARDFTHKHEAVEKFVHVRGLDPRGGEPISSLSPRGRYKSMHVSRARAATTWIDDEDVCWLLAYGPYHASGDVKDVYEYFKQLDNRSELAPTAEDFMALSEETTEHLLIKLAEEGEKLIAEARANIGKEILGTFYKTAGRAALCVDMSVQEFDGSMEEGTIAIIIDAPWPAIAIVDVIQALLPDNSEIIQTANPGGREAMPGELVFTWSLLQE